MNNENNRRVILTLNGLTEQEIEVIKDFTSYLKSLPNLELTVKKDLPKRKPTKRVSMSKETFDTIIDLLKGINKKE